MPFRPGNFRAASMAWSASITPAISAPFCEPRSRSRRVSFRVSMSEIATTPRAFSHSGSAIWLRQLLGRRGTSRTISPAAKTWPDSSSWLVQPVLPICGVGQGHQLTGVGGIGEDLLIAGDGGVEHHLTDRQAGCACGNALEYGSVFERKNGGLGHDARLVWVNHLGPPGCGRPRTGRRPGSRLKKGFRRAGILAGWKPKRNARPKPGVCVEARTDYWPRLGR